MKLTSTTINSFPSLVCILYTECNCERVYYYTKTWRDRRINSFAFQQPANHHNPQRDPYPSTSMVSYGLSVGSYTVLPEVSKAIRGVSRSVSWTRNREPMPRTFIQGITDYLFGAPPPSRWEEVASLVDTVHSPAAHDHQFLYTNTAEGWFFSPYTAPTWDTVLRGFGQFVEGSLFDWQIGDLYDKLNGCTAGDIRVRFSVVDPLTISVVGGARKHTDRTPEIGTHHVRSVDFELNIMHAGEHSADSMFDNETKEAYHSAWSKRFLSLLTGLASTILIQKYTGLWMKDRADEKFFFLAWAGLSLCFLFGVWAAVYGLNDFKGADTAIETIVVGVSGVVLFVASVLMRGGSTDKGIKRRRIQRRRSCCKRKKPKKLK